MSCYCYVLRREFAVSRVDTSKCDFLLGYGFRIKEGTQFVKSAATTLRDGGVVLLPPAHYQQSSLAPPTRLSSVLLSPEVLSCCQPVALSLYRRFLAANPTTSKMAEKVWRLLLCFSRRDVLWSVHSLFGSVLQLLYVSCVPASSCPFLY